MKSVLCPIDFSPAAENGMEYAAHLAKALSARLTLFYVQPSVWPEAVQLEHEVMTSVENISSRLVLFSTEIQNKFDIPCDYAIDHTTNTVEGAIAAKANSYSLIALGTNGAENLYQHAFGSTTFRVIEQSKCPIVFVPEGYAYKPLKTIVYAYDPETNPIFLIDQLQTLAIVLQAELRVLHISTEPRTEETERKIGVVMDALKAREKRPISWSFEFQYSDDVAWALDQYMLSHQANLLALSCHHHSVLQKLFKDNVVKQLSRVASYPVLVFWH